MTVAEAIGKFDKLKPNQYGNEQKVEWLSDLDKRLVDLVFAKHENNPAEDWQPYELYSEGVDGRELLVPDEFSDLYITYLTYKVDYFNGEFERFNNAALLYNTHLQEFMAYWNRENKPLKKTDVVMK